MTEEIDGFSEEDEGRIVNVVSAVTGFAEALLQEESVPIAGATYGILATRLLTMVYKDMKRVSGEAKARYYLQQALNVMAGIPDGE